MAAPNGSMEVPNSKPKRHLSRRDFLKLIGLAGLGSLPGLYYGIQIEPASIEITQIKLTIPRLGNSFSGLRLAQISDIHFGGWTNAERLQTALDLLEDQKPDYVVFTGDMVMAYPWEEVLTTLGDLTTILTELVQHLPVFAVMGNHDHWGDVKVVRKLYADSGVHELRNDVFVLKRAGDALTLAGVDDLREKKSDLGLVLERLPKDGPAILLAHEPDFVLKSSATRRFALQLSGHSHGGQVVLPFIGPPILPYMAHRYPSGLYRVGQMYQYTNRGVGMTPPFVRLNCRPEITVFTLESG